MTPDKTFIDSLLLLSSNENPFPTDIENNDLNTEDSR